MIRVILQVFKNYSFKKVSSQRLGPILFAGKGQLIQIRINGIPV